MKHTYTTESAAWQAIADVLESGEMPAFFPISGPIFGPHYTCAGLCSIITRLHREGHISKRLREAMTRRISVDLKALGGFGHYGPLYEVRERLEVARRFEKESA